MLLIGLTIVCAVSVADYSQLDYFESDKYRLVRFFKSVVVFREIFVLTKFLQITDMYLGPVLFSQKNRFTFKIGCRKND